MKDNFVSEVSFRHITGSTNDDAIHLARLGAPEGTLVLTDYQTNGKGRFGRRWMAAPKSCILMSLILRPTISPERFGLITVVASVSTAVMISRTTGMKAQIKWPNDVMVKGRKVAGILVEAGYDLEGSPFSVLGMGINVNVPKEGFPGEIRSKAISLSELTGGYLDRFELIDMFLSEFEPRYRELNSGTWDSILSEYRLLSWTLGKPVNVLANGERMCGLALDVGDYGELILRLPDGRTERAFSGESSLD
jgi:BirA family biotin operon repressor/biotin-[acetyl-CoA-carboxylase] ligase